MHLLLLFDYVQVVSVTVIIAQSIQIWIVPYSGAYPRLVEGGLGFQFSNLSEK